MAGGAFRQELRPGDIPLKGLVPLGFAPVHLGEGRAVDDDLGPMPQHRFFHLPRLSYIKLLAP